MKEIIWRQIRLEVPTAWEMLLFSLPAAQGHCLFADRYEHRLELRWQAVNGTPDLERMVSDYAGLLQADARVRDVSQTTTPPWLGLGYRAADVQGARFVRYLPELGLVTELTFLWPGPRDTTLEETLLRSLRAEPPDATGGQRWRAFGLDCIAGAGLVLHACAAQPGRALLHFTAPRHPGHEEQYERLGMVDEWLKRPVPEWLGARLPRDLVVREQTNYELRGHQVTQICGTRPARTLAKLWGRRLHVSAAAWICPVDGRLYQARVDAPTAAPNPLAGHRLTCCAALRSTAGT